MSRFGKRYSQDTDFSMLKKYALPALYVNLKTIDTAEPVYIEKYGGKPARNNDKPWPVCTSCAAHQTFVCQFELNGSFWRFFYCFDCAPWNTEGMNQGLCSLEREDGDLDALILQNGPTKESVSFPELEWELIEALDAPSNEDEVEGLNKKDREQLVKDIFLFDNESLKEKRANAGLQPYTPTMLGGYSHFIQENPESICPHCNKDMLCMARLGSLARHSELNDVLHIDEKWSMWGDFGAVFLLFCPEHAHLKDGVGFELQSG